MVEERFSSLSSSEEDERGALLSCGVRRASCSKFLRP